MSQDTINLNLEPRTVTGKAVKKLRAEGTIPAVIHDHGKASVVVQGDAIQMLKVWQKAGKHHPVQLKSGTQNYTALIRTATFNPKRNELSHVVFNAVKANEKVEAEVPIHAKYDEGNEVSPAERSGLIVLAQLDVVTVKAIPSKLPDELFYNAEKLVAVGDHATVADLEVPEGVEIETEAEHTIATVFEPSALAAANDAAGGDAEADDVSSVDSDNGSSDGTDAQDAENQPGGQQGAPKAE